MIVVSTLLRLKEELNDANRVVYTKRMMEQVLWILNGIALNEFDAPWTIVYIKEMTNKLISYEVPTGVQFKFY
jgi:hypothetical protein